jgi:hypothetical protein
MKEIGGYFGLESFTEGSMYSGLVGVNSARNALVYLLYARRINKLYIPYYLCNSVSGVCEREGFAYEYYNIGNDLLPIFDKELGEGEYLYVVNYFGQLDDGVILSLKARYGNLILDNVQAFFHKPIEGIDTLYSCRKFFGVPDGGYVSTDAKLVPAPARDVSMNRMKHVLGRFEGESASDYYGDFRANDDAFETLELRLMSRLTENIMNAVDYDRVKKAREENFAALDSLLGDKNGLKVRLPAGPYAYPFYCKGGMAIKKALAAKKIFVPTLWPEVAEMGQELESDLAQNILPLPCDQRYGKEDMERIAEELCALLG